MGVHVSSFLWDISPCRSNPAASTKNGGRIFDTISHAIYLCGMHEVNPTVRKIYIMWLTSSNAQEHELKSFFCRLDFEVCRKFETHNLLAFFFVQKPAACCDTFCTSKAFEPRRFGQVNESHTKIFHKCLICAKKTKSFSWLPFVCSFFYV